MYCGNTGWNGYWNKSTESWPWRRKFSCHSSRDSNPRPFDHEPGTLTTELLPTPQNTFPVGQDGPYNHCNTFPAGPGRAIQEVKMSSLSKPSQYFGLCCLYVVGACDVYTFLVEDTGCYCSYIMGGGWFSWEIYVAEGVDGILIKNIWHLHVVKSGQHSCHVHISVYELRYLGTFRGQDCNNWKKYSAQSCEDCVFVCFVFFTHESIVKVEGELDIRSRVIPTIHLAHGKQTDAGKLSGQVVTTLRMSASWLRSARRCPQFCPLLSWDLRSLSYVQACLPRFGCKTIDCRETWTVGCSIIIIYLKKIGDTDGREIFPLVKRVNIWYYSTALGETPPKVGLWRCCKLRQPWNI